MKYLSHWLLAGVFLCIILLEFNMVLGQNKTNVIVFSGHMEKPIKGNSHGAMSCTGIWEYLYNDNILAALKKHNEKDNLNYVFLPATDNISLRERPKRARKESAEVYLEIHHDSGQAQDIEAQHWEEMEGFSIFYSAKNDQPEQSRRLAEYIGDEFVKAGFKPNHYHAKDIPGERRNEVDPKRAIYKRDLYVNAYTSMPSVLIECGCLVCPDEEKRLRQPETQQKLAEVIHRGVKNFLRTLSD